MEIIEGVDMYLRSLAKDNDYHIFCDDEDIMLYTDTTPDEIMEYTKKTLSDFLRTVNPEYKINKETLIVMFVSSFILSIKFYLDCVVFKPYSTVWGIIENEFENEFETDFSRLLKKSIKMEKEILEKTNFFSEMYKIDL